MLISSYCMLMILSRPHCKQMTFTCRKIAFRGTGFTFDNTGYSLNSGRCVLLVSLYRFRITPGRLDCKQMTFACRKIAFRNTVYSFHSTGFSFDNKGYSLCTSRCLAYLSLPAPEIFCQPTQKGKNNWEFAEGGVFLKAGNAGLSVRAQHFIRVQAPCCSQRPESFRKV